MGWKLGGWSIGEESGIPVSYTHLLELGTLVMGRYDEAKIQEILDLPENYDVSCIIAIGHPAVIPAANERKSLDVYKRQVVKVLSLFTAERLGEGFITFTAFRLVVKVLVFSPSIQGLSLIHI